MYGFGIFLYLLALILASPFKAKARQMLAGRWRWRKKLAAALPAKNGKRIWFHCASLGEFEMVKPILDKLKKQQPEVQVVISFFSPSGYLQKRNYPCEGVFYLPLDFKRNARDWYRLVQPDVAVFVKYEFWLRFMQYGHKAGVKMLATGCLFREGQFIFEPWADNWKKALLQFDRIFVQNTDSLERAHSEGLRNSVLSGDTRFDRVIEVRETAREIDWATRFKGENTLCIGGSTWPPEEKMLRNMLNRIGIPIKTRFILVPHDISDSHTDSICRQFADLECTRLSQIKSAEIPEHCKMIVVDEIGLLSALYRYADVAIIGGAWGKGLHNMLEAAVWGMPILFGPKHHKFPEAALSIEAGFGFECSNEDEFEKHLKTGLGNPEKRLEAAMAAKRFVEQHAGASEAVVSHICSIIEN